MEKLQHRVVQVFKDKHGDDWMICSCGEVEELDNHEEMMSHIWERNGGKDQEEQG